MSRIVMSLHYSDFEDIFININTSCISLICGHQLTRNHAEHPSRSIYFKCLRSKFINFESTMSPCSQEFVYFRSLKLFELAIIEHTLALLVDLLDCKIFKIIYYDEIRKISERNGTTIIQPKISSCISASNLDC